jgi:hypothetical protein
VIGRTRQARLLRAEPGRAGKVRHIVLGIGRMVRGVWLMIILATIFSGVLLVSCLARLIYGDGSSDVAGKLRPGA